MKFPAFSFALAVSALTQAQILPQAPTVAAKSWLLLDYSTGQALASYNPDERVEPASLTKLMTAYVVLGALKEKAASSRAGSAGVRAGLEGAGSRMFIEPKRPGHGRRTDARHDRPVGQRRLHRAGRGDGRLRGSLRPAMNREAQRLGLKSTRFRQRHRPARSAALHDGARPGHAGGGADPRLPRALPALLAARIHLQPHQPGQPQPPALARSRRRWRQDRPHRERRLLPDRFGQARPRRLLSVVMGTASDGMRTQESQKLLNFGFQFFDAVKLYAKDQAVSQLKVWKGAQNTVKAGFLEDFTLSLPKGMAEKLKASLVSRQPLVAPVQKGSASPRSSSRSTTSPTANIPSWRWRPCRWPA
jgi:D-alanyl-D-alanine carboxypeptidase (penicillin-binding protein 5/6)